MKSTQKGLLKNVQDGISRPIGSQEIQEIKVATVLRDTLYLKGILLIHLLSSVPAPVHLKCVPDIGKLELHPEVCKDILIDYQQLLQPPGCSFSSTRGLKERPGNSRWRPKGPIIFSPELRPASRNMDRQRESESHNHPTPFHYGLVVFSSHA